MIKKFEDYCVNESIEKSFSKVKFKKDCRQALVRIRRGNELNFKEEILEAIKDDNYTKAIEQLAELFLYLIRRKKHSDIDIVKNIKKILDYVNFGYEEFDLEDYLEDVKNSVSVRGYLYDSDDDELNKDTVKKSKFYFVREVARKYFDERLKEKDSRLFELFKEQPEEEDELRIKEIRRFLGKNFGDVDYRKLTSIESYLIEGEEYGCYYTVKDIKNICHEIKSKYHKSDRIIGFLKHFLDSRENIEYKERTIEKDNFNLAVSVNGKVLSSPFYYNPILGICAQTSEEMRDLIDYFKESIIYKTLLDYYENIPDIDEIIEK